MYVAQASSKYDVFTMNADGSAATQITKLAAASIGNARFTADGTKIVFDAIIVSGGTRGLYTIGLDGTNQQPVTLSTTGNNTLQDAR